MRLEEKTQHLPDKRSAPGRPVPWIHSRFLLLHSVPPGAKATPRERGGGGEKRERERPGQ